MPSSAPTRRLWIFAGLALLVLAGGAVYLLWQHQSRLPQPGSELYEQYAEAFEVGTAALDSGLWPQATEHLNRAIELIPQEPAAWANRGLLHLWSNQLDKARADLQKAASLAPGQPRIQELLGYVLMRDNAKVEEAVELIRKAYQADPNNLQLLYTLVTIASTKGEAGDAERQQLLEELLQLRPNSLPLLIERLQLALQKNDREALRTYVARLRKLAPNWTDAAREALAEVEKEMQGDFDERDLTVKIGMLNNVLKTVPGYLRSAEELRPASGQVGATLQQFIRLAPLKTDPSSPDFDLTFVKESREWQPEVGASRWEVMQPVWLTGKSDAAVLLANSSDVRRGDAVGPRFDFPGNGQPPSLAGILAVDWNNDHATDLLLVGAGGLRLHQQQKDGTFEDITNQVKLPPEILTVAGWGAWAVDLDQDGDLDIVLATREAGVWTLRNNGDGTFLAMPSFPEVQRARAFCWGDLDNDGVSDAVFLDTDGRMHVYMNERLGLFRRRAAPDLNSRFAALTVLDGNDDGTMDLAALATDGIVYLFSDLEKGTSWRTTRLASWEKPPSLVPGATRLQAVDLDCNGTIDLVARTSEGGIAWLADASGTFTALGAELPPGVSEIVGLQASEHLEVLGWGEAKAPTLWRTQGTKGYHWYYLRPRADPAGTGDQRMNSYAIGSEIELRAGTLIVKQPVTLPVVHFGLGTRTRVSVTRCVWTTGAQQFEFDKPGDGVIVIEQRLTGSCPFLFTYDGEGMVFVTDFCWSTPLGLYINAQKRGGGFIETTEWIRIRGEQLRPRDGIYDVRVNANLWETHFLDQLSLMSVDHPPGTEVYCDERFFLTPTKPRLYLTEPARPVERVFDHLGQDVTDLVRAVDGRYLDRAGRGLYQGVTRDHWVELDLGHDLPNDGPVYLIGHGWLHPTDSSINAALEQSSHPRPQPLSLEVPDGSGGWKVALPALGFPAGKNKTVVLRLDGIDGPGVPRRVRLRTNLEIFWDALHLARGLDPSLCRLQTLPCQRAELRYRGMLAMTRQDRSSPEIPHYEQIEHGRQPWRDLIGYHTRFGDVRELLTQIDDRYVILNAGDEIALEFEAPAEPAPGWQRDFVWISDGWTKDGNLNTRWSKTVLPLPYHGMTDYDTPPGRLEDDPVYRRFPQDWHQYHTRYVTPLEFERGLRPLRRWERGRNSP